MSWHDWGRLEKHREIFRFTRSLIALRRAHPIFSAERFYTDEEIQWFGPQGDTPRWTDPKEKLFACRIREDELNTLFLMFNAGQDAVDFHLPSLPVGAGWHLAVDTSHTPPQDFFIPGEEPVYDQAPIYPLGPRSSAILLGRIPTPHGKNMESFK